MPIATASNPVQKTWLRNVLDVVRQRWAGWLFISVLAIGAIGSARIALQTKPKDVRVTAGPSLKHEPDFEATRLDAWRTSEDGLTRTHMVAEKVVHFRDDLSSTYTHPRFTVTSKATQTQVQADAAAARNDGEELSLQGKVQVQRTPLLNGTKASKPATLNTDTLTLYPDSGVALSRVPTVLTQGKRTVEASGGFEFRSSEANIVLLGPVRATVLPIKN